MKIERIKYRNYRCFNDVEIVFDTTTEKNIFMVLAPNGGGKTEMLFSFQWVLYGFEFNTLKGKESTPYSLNSTLYQELKERGRVGDKKVCTVEMDFESDGVSYRVVRKEIFKRSSHGVGKPEHELALSWKNPNGTRSLAITNEDEYLDKLSKIIPMSVLRGILFDGERMKQLAASDKDSQEAVEGVIRQITNQSLLERCTAELKELSKEVNKEHTRISKKLGNLDTAEIDDALKERRNDLSKNEVRLDARKKELETLTARLDEIHIELDRNEESKQFEEKRKELRDELDAETSILDKKFDELQDYLIDGYQLICDPLFDNVEELLQSYDIPAGLTVDAVRHILERDTCICGHPFTPESRSVLEDLISKLPPDNVNSTIGEMVRQQRRSKEKLQDILGRVYGDIQTSEKRINQLKEQIDNISAQITTGAPELIKQLEEENKKSLKRLGVLEEEIPMLEKEIERLKKEIKALEKSRTEGSQSNSVLARLDSKDAFISKCINAIDAINKHNQMHSLRKIAERINAAYQQISEDFDNGRRLYIVQYDEKSRYRLASFLQPKLKDMFEKAAKDNMFKIWERDGLSKEEMLERIIMLVLESNSTGQSKINSLAFAKAILDYSRSSFGSEEAEITKSYPFLIDSPFTELSDGNLRKSAAAINSFAEQVILMISSESLEGVSDLIEPHIGGRVTLKKSSNNSESTVAK